MLISTHKQLKPNFLPSITDDKESLNVIKRAAETVPSMCLYVDGTPGFFPPPKETYLQNMADPSESNGFTMLSFYRFSQITDPDEMALKLMQLWKPFKAYGKCYIFYFCDIWFLKLRL